MTLARISLTTAMRDSRMSSRSPSAFIAPPPVARTSVIGPAIDRHVAFAAVGGQWQLLDCRSASGEGPQRNGGPAAGGISIRDRNGASPATASAASTTRADSRRRRRVARVLRLNATHHRISHGEMIIDPPNAGGLLDEDAQSPLLFRACNETPEAHDPILHHHVQVIRLEPGLRS